MWNDAEMKIKIIMLVFGCDKMEVPGGIKRNRERGNHHMYQYMHSGSSKMRWREKDTQRKTFENVRAKSLPNWKKSIYIHSQELIKTQADWTQRDPYRYTLESNWKKVKNRKNILEVARKKSI